MWAYSCWDTHSYQNKIRYQSHAAHSDINYSLVIVTCISCTLLIKIYLLVFYFYFNYRTFWTKWEAPSREKIVNVLNFFTARSQIKRLKSTEHVHASHTAALQLYLVGRTGTVSSISVAMMKGPAYCLLWLLNVLVVNCNHADGTQLTSCLKDCWWSL
jgi:hypothetical protein